MGSQQRKFRVKRKPQPDSITGQYRKDAQLRCHPFLFLVLF